MAAGTHEAQAHSTTGIDNRKLLMWLFLASECLFFGAMISAYLIYQDRIFEGPTPSEVFNIQLTTISTFILLMSSLSMVLAVYAVQHHQVKFLRMMLLTTILGGLIFLAIQGYEWYHLWTHYHLDPTTNQFGATFYFLTGFHKVHVGVGLVYLFGLLVTSMRRRGLGRDQVTQVDVAGLYWHFVDLAWIVIFTVVILIPASGAMG